MEVDKGGALWKGAPSRRLGGSSRVALALALAGTSLNGAARKEEQTELERFVCFHEIQSPAEWRELFLSSRPKSAAPAGPADRAGAVCISARRSGSPPNGSRRSSRRRPLAASRAQLLRNTLFAPLLWETQITLAQSGARKYQSAGRFNQSFGAGHFRRAPERSTCALARQHSRPPDAGRRKCAACCAGRPARSGLQADFFNYRQVEGANKGLFVSRARHSRK